VNDLPQTEEKGVSIMKQTPVKSGYLIIHVGVTVVWYVYRITYGTIDQLSYRAGLICQRNRL